VIGVLQQVAKLPLGNIQAANSCQRFYITKCSDQESSFRLTKIVCI
jgi:hypothetical protein